MYFKNRQTLSIAIDSVIMIIDLIGISSLGYCIQITKFLLAYFWLNFEIFLAKRKHADLKYNALSLAIVLFPITFQWHQNYY